MYTATYKKFLEKEGQLALYQLWVQKEFPNAPRIELVWDFVAHAKEIKSSCSEKC